MPTNHKLELPSVMRKRQWRLENPPLPTVFILVLKSKNEAVIKILMFCGMKLGKAEDETAKKKDDMFDDYENVNIKSFRSN